MSQFVICTLAQTRRGGFSDLVGDRRWVYLGKDLAQRDAAAHLLGEKALLPLNDRLHAIAETLRQPFLDFIGNLGQMQTDQLGWWSSSSSWKIYGRSDLFLLICYERVVGDLLREFKDHQEHLVVVIEDPWLFRQLVTTYGSFPEIQFCGKPSVWPTCLSALLRGVGSRLIWSLRLLYNYLRQRWYWKQDKHDHPATSSIAVYSYPQARCLSGTGRWTDPCLGDIDGLVEEAGHSVLRFSPPEVGGFERAIAQRAHYFTPLILWITPRSLLRSLSASWHPVWPASVQVEGMPVRWLLLRDWWLDRWRSSYLLYRVFFDCLSKLLETRPIKLLLYPYENQPWERMLVLAAHAHGVPTLAYQHGGGLARFMLPYFHGSTEAQWAPLPDLIVTSGTYPYGLLATGGTPRKRLVIGGNLRHQYLSNRRHSIPTMTSSGHVRVLVALPIEHDLTQHLLSALRRAFPDGGLSEGIGFAIKPHPMAPIREQDLQWPATIVGGTFEEATISSSMVLYSGSGTGMEAYVMGRVVLRYRSELLLNTDRAECLTGEMVVDCGDHDLKDKVLSAVRMARASHINPAVDDLLKQVFAPPDRAVWLRAIDQLCSRHSSQCPPLAECLKHS